MIKLNVRLSEFKQYLFCSSFKGIDAFLKDPFRQVDGRAIWPGLHQHMHGCARIRTDAFSSLSELNTLQRVLDSPNRLCPG